MAGQEVGHTRGILAMGAHAQVQRLQAFQVQPGVEGADRRAGVADEGLQVIVQEVLAAQHHSAQGSALAVDVFGRGMDHDMGAELHRSLQDGRGEGVVYRQQRSAFLGDPGHRLQVDDRKRRIGRGLQEQQLGVGPHGRPPLVDVFAVHQGKGDAEARQDGFHHMAAGAEHRLGRDDMVAGRQIGQHRR